MKPGHKHSQADELLRRDRIEECQRIVAGASWYTRVEREHAALMLATIYKEGK